MKKKKRRRRPERFTTKEQETARTKALKETRRLKHATRAYGNNQELPP